MATVRLSPEALNTWQRLRDDVDRQPLFDAIDQVLDQIEIDPGQRDLRRRRFRDPPLWCVVVEGQDDVWVVLWDEDPERPGDVLVDYIGSASFA